jgi:hypothetical protein
MHITDNAGLYRKYQSRVRADIGRVLEQTNHAEAQCLRQGPPHRKSRGAPIERADRHERPDDGAPDIQPRPPLDIVDGKVVR